MSIYVRPWRKNKFKKGNNILHFNNKKLISNILKNIMTKIVYKIIKHDLMKDNICHELYKADLS